MGTSARQAGHGRAGHVTRRPTSHATYPVACSTAPHVVGSGPGSRASGSMGTRGRLPLLFSCHPSPQKQVNPAQWQWHRRRGMCTLAGWFGAGGGCHKRADVAIGEGRNRARPPHGGKSMQLGDRTHRWVVAASSRRGL